MIHPIQALQQGTIIAYPTEAVYGLGCDPLCEAAVLRLLTLKKRSITKGLILIAASLKQVMPYIDSTAISSERMQQILASWPGPVTWVFPASDKVPSWIRGNHTTVAVRVTAHPIAKALCADFGRPIVSTSANTEGHPPARDAQTVAKIFPSGIEVIVSGEVGNLTKPTEIRDACSNLVLRT